MSHNQRSYTRFVIISSHRSGSNYLSGLLASHPNIISIGELYNPSVLFSEPGKPKLQENFVMQKIRDVAPVWFLKQFIYHAYPKDVYAVGFRYFYLHAEGRFKPVLDYLKKERDIRIIHLKRNNLLRSFYSLRLAQETGVWTVRTRSGITQPKKRLILSAEDCRAYFLKMEKYMTVFDTCFSGHKVLEISYESLCENKTGQHKRLLSFLKVPPRTLSASTVKLGVAQLRRGITNFDELKRHFRSTRWYWFFI